MPSVSRSQQRYFGMVHACQKDGKCASPAVRKTAHEISFKDAKEFASTKHKGLPGHKKPKKKKKNESVYPTFREWLESKKKIILD